MRKTPYIGQLKYPIVIQTEIKERGTTGEEKVTGYENVMALYAQLDDQQGTEDVEGKVRRLVDRSYVVRYRVALLDRSVTYYVFDRGQRYKVYNVVELKPRAFLQLLVNQYD